MAGRIGRALVVFLVSLTGIMNVAANQCAIEGNCKAGETCCEQIGGQYGCCPYHNGVCCPNQEYCCPSGYYCLYKTCVKQGAIPSIIYKMTPKEIAHQHQNIEKCPSHFTSCINNRDGQIQYCCPIPNAVCCNDQQHCCPPGTTCSSQKRGCEWELVITSFVFMTNAFPVSSSKRLPAPMIQATGSDTPCPGYFSCPPNNTCCLSPDVRFTCCPFKDAACCAEGTYCCPYGTYCIGSFKCKRIL